MKKKLEHFLENGLKFFIYWHILMTQVYLKQKIPLVCEPLNFGSVKLLVHELFIYIIIIKLTVQELVFNHSISIYCDNLQLYTINN